MKKTRINKKHKIIAIVSSVIALICLAIGIWFIVERNANKWELKQNEVTVEYGEIYEPRIADLVDVEKYSNVKNSNTSIQINNASYVINSKNHNTPMYYDIGDYDIDVVHKVEYKLFGATIFTMDETKKVKLSIKDTIAPVFAEDAPTELETYKDCEIENIEEKFKATDLAYVTISIDKDKIDYSTVGEYTINVYATDANGNVTNKEIKIKVLEPTVELDKTSLNMTVGDTSTITATVKGKDKTVEWNSSDESVTKVENGNITAYKAGKATIKAKANGVEATSEVTINEKVVVSSNNNNKPSSSNNSGSSSKPSSSGGSSSGSNNNGGSSRPSPNGSTGNSGNNSSTTTTTKPVWCWEGGSKHVTPVGIGWYSSYKEAQNAALSYGTGAGHFEVQECDCGKFTAYIN